MKIYIDRYDPETQRKWTENFDIDESVLEGKTVMSLLNYISLNFDSSIAYYSHSVCDHGICGRCLISLNGKTSLACLTPVSGLKEIRLSPVPTRRLVRDLVTK